MSGLEKEIAEQEKKYLTLLSTKFKNIGETATEIINLQAIMNLPKGTEHFLTDIHGAVSYTHLFKKRDLELIQKRADSMHASFIITTEKDLVKLPGELNIENRYLLKREVTVLEDNSLKRCV